MVQAKRYGHAEIKIHYLICLPLKVGWKVDLMSSTDIRYLRTMWGRPKVDQIWWDPHLLIVSLSRMVQQRVKLDLVGLKSITGSLICPPVDLVGWCGLAWRVEQPSTSEGYIVTASCRCGLEKLVLISELIIYCPCLTWQIVAHLGGGCCLFSVWSHRT